MRTRELCLERAHQFLGETDWSELVLSAAGGDLEVATEVLELLDAVTPGEDAATLRRGEATLEEYRRRAEASGELPPEEPGLRFYKVGLVFGFYALGGVCLTKDSPARRYGDGEIYYLRTRTVAELAAVIGKACAVAAVRPFRPRVAPAARPVQPAAPPAREANPYKAGYVQDPDAEDRE
jgi:hypothetical protein